MSKLFIYHVRETGEHRGRLDNDSGKPEESNYLIKHSPLPLYSNLLRLQPNWGVIEQLNTIRFWVSCTEKRSLK